MNRNDSMPVYSEVRAIAVSGAYSLVRDDRIAALKKIKLEKRVDYVILKKGKYCILVLKLPLCQILLQTAGSPFFVV